MISNDLLSGRSGRGKTHDNLALGGRSRPPREVWSGRVVHGWRRLDVDLRPGLDLGTARLDLRPPDAGPASYSSTE